MTKAELRKLYLERRRELSVSEIAVASKQIADRFFRDIDLDGVKALSTFIRIPKFNEVDTSAIYYRLWKDRPWIKTYAPKADLESGELENLTLFPDTPLTENRWGVREPAAGDMADAVSLDAVIVPLLCVDTVGHRVGYGKGFYDRFLAKCRPGCLKIGVHYFAPVEGPIDAAKHDIRLDACVTPDETYRF
jgi:5-formyltetrahydrofolate cyclo-ligase